jgi:hypothetical protein
MIAFVLLTIYTWQNRYFLRFLPIPLELANTINEIDGVLPIIQDGKIAGKADFSARDLTTETGLRKTLNAFQGISPFKRTNGFVNYQNITFQKWIAEIHEKPFFCTDATLMFILVAKAQGIIAREWHLLPKDWPGGQGHSVVEFFNPRVKKWQVVDAQHAGIIRNREGDILSMLEVLKIFKQGRRQDLVIDYGPFRQQMLAGARGAPTGKIFFESGLLNAPVLQLRQPTWFKEYPRKFLISGQFIIGYPLIINGWTHDNRVIYSKISALGMILAGFLFVIYLNRFRRAVSSQINAKMFSKENLN